MNLTFGEVVLIRVHFHQAVGSKVRAAVVVLDVGDNDFVAAPITSQLRNAEYDLVLEGWRIAGLNVASLVRVHKLTVLTKANIARSLTGLSPRDGAALRELLCRAFCTGIAAK